MPQSLSSIYLHLVFSIKDRRPYLRDDQHRNELHAYLGEISNRLDAPSLVVGGVEDHVHLLCRFGRKSSVSDWVKELKRVSSIWVKGKSEGLSEFSWQAGYGVFSVSPSHIDAVTKYIENQEEHHQKLSFKDEFRNLLKKHNVKYDEKYVWD